MIELVQMLVEERPQLEQEHHNHQMIELRIRLVERMRFAEEQLLHTLAVVVVVEERTLVVGRNLVVGIVELEMFVVALDHSLVAAVEQKFVAAVEQTFVAAVEQTFAVVRARVLVLERVRAQVLALALVLDRLVLVWQRVPL
jgi:hypothetical protein